MPVCRLNGCQIHFVEVGTGSPLLLVHGFPLDHTMWVHQMAGLQAAGRVIALDLPGFGASSSCAEEMSIIGFADLLVEFLDQLGLERVIVCGLSMGGSIAQQFALRYPERLSGLILCDCRAAIDPPETQKMRHDLADRVLREGPEFVAQAMPARLFAPRTLVEQPDVVIATQNVIRANRPESVAGGSRALADREDVVSRLGQVSTRTLLIVGTEDVISTVGEMHAMAAAIPNSQLVEIPGAGHMAPLERPSLVNQAILKWWS